jgi:hypothetical protein
MRDRTNWTQEDEQKIQKVYSYINAVSAEMTRREELEAQQDKDAKEAMAEMAMENHEFDQDDFDREQYAYAHTVGRKMPSLDELLAMPSDRQIHYRCNICYAPALDGSFYPGKFCSEGCATQHYNS